MDITSPTVYLVRAGQTPKIGAEWLRGHEPLDLDARGLAEARATAAALAVRGLHTVITSPLPRAVHTATIIADAAHLTPIVDEAFIDRDYGWWTGQLALDVTERWGSVDAAPGVERIEVVWARAQLALDRLLTPSPAGAVAVVSHHTVIMALLAALDPNRHPLVPTGSWATLHHDRSTWRVLAVDQRATDRPVPTSEDLGRRRGQSLLPGQRPTKKAG